MFLCCCRRKGKPLISLAESNIEQSGTNRLSNLRYEPPENIADSEARLSLPTAPAQQQSNISQFSPTKHLQKSGYVKKRGHLVKNWKRRFMVLKDGNLTYYASGTPSATPSSSVQDGQNKKGSITLAGAKIETSPDNGCRFQILTPALEKSLTVEVETLQESEEWIISLSDAIRAGNSYALLSGQRIPQAVQWYMEEHYCYEEAVKVLEFGHMFKLHYFDLSGVIHLVKIWLQASSDLLGLVVRTSLDTAGSPVSAAQAAPSRRASVGSRNPVLKKIEGKELPFVDIVNVTKGTTDNVSKTKDMGPDSAFFSVRTSEMTYVLEVESRAKRDQWAIAIRDVVNFIHIPIPGVKPRSSRSLGTSSSPSTSFQYRR